MTDTTSGESLGHLVVTNVSIAYGGVHAVKSVSLSVPKNELHVILGANGAGKSSIIRAIMGLARIQSGSIEIAGVAGTESLLPHRIHRLGVAWVPEGREVFSDLTIEDNLLMGGFSRGKRSVLIGDLEEKYRRFPILGERRFQLAGSLSGGEQQMLAISRALMAEPSILLLDEPSLGLAPKVVTALFDFIGEIRQTLGMTILMAEQNARQALRVSDYAYLLENGTLRLSGRSRDMEKQEEVRKAYLGG